MTPSDTMTRERYEFLIRTPTAHLTQAELDQGYRFCCEWDGLLVHITHHEAFCCDCLKAAFPEAVAEGVFERKPS